MTLTASQSAHVQALDAKRARLKHLGEPPHALCGARIKESSAGTGGYCLVCADLARRDWSQR